MATTEADIANMALSRIGIKAFIDSLTDEGTEAEACALWYEHARDATLEAFEWAFAKQHATLALITDGERSGWAYAYELPAGCIAPRRLYAGERDPSSTARIPFELEANDAGDGKILLTDLEDAELIYTQRIETVPAFPASFVDALAWRLAAELVTALSVKLEMRPMAERAFRIALLEAKAAALSQRQSDIPKDADHILERG